MTEKEIFELIKRRVLSIQKEKDKPVRLAINGIEGTGKTVFAEKLTQFLNSEKFQAIHVSIDGFHFNKEVRYRQGRDSALGYYEDSYDEMAFVEKVLKSSQSETPNITRATHDLATDQYLELKPIEIDKDAILITDGAYLFKPNYRAHWDLKIYLKTSFDIAMNRGVERDKKLLGGSEMAKRKFKDRYHRASMIYLANDQPESIADLIIDNSEFNNLKLIKNTIAHKDNSPS